MVLRRAKSVSFSSLANVLAMSLPICLAACMKRPHSCAPRSPGLRRRCCCWAMVPCISLAADLNSAVRSRLVMTAADPLDRDVVTKPVAGVRLRPGGSSCSEPETVRLRSVLIGLSSGHPHTPYATWTWEPASIHSLGCR
uniref:Putative secreted protein n=1 Tax=Amblyomma americanum TaxID=6943 RepID=A0A0C9SDM4_AMBAM